jgi:diguanylate cyclase (GGDEF)-like protein
MVDEESRWSLLPTLLTRAARLGIESDKLNALVDAMVRRWREWGATLQLRTQDLPPFAEILAASPPMRRMGSSGDSENKRNRTPSLLVQLIGVAPDERLPITQQIEDLGHRAELLEATDQGLQQALAHPGQIIIVEMASAGVKAAEFCRQLRQSALGKDNYALLLASPDQQSSAQQAVDAGADDVLIKPLNAQTLRVHLNAATRMLILKEEIQRERIGVMRSTDEFAVAQKRLLQDALTDPLTQLPNRRNGLDFLESEWVFAQTSGAPLACLMLDIDHFKRVNDDYGHAAGDAVLRQLADILKSSSRSVDLVFRYGGEEFAAILTNADLRSALQIGERIRAQVEQNEFRWEQQRIPLTLSVGVAVAPAARGDSLMLIQAADAALYQAKAAGRNRVVAAK